MASSQDYQEEAQSAEKAETIDIQVSAPRSWVELRVGEVIRAFCYLKNKWGTLVCHKVQRVSDMNEVTTHMVETFMHYAWEKSRQKHGEVWERKEKVSYSNQYIEYPKRGDL